MINNYHHPYHQQLNIFFRYVHFRLLGNNVFIGTQWRWRRVHIHWRVRKNVLFVLFLFVHHFIGLIKLNRVALMNVQNVNMRVIIEQLLRMIDSRLYIHVSIVQEK